MKLVSLERIKNYIQTQINPYGKPFKGTAYEFGIKLLDYLSNKDADYDVDKVLEQLEDKVKEYDERIEKRKSANFFDETERIKQFDERAWGIENAIEIVKGGVVDGLD